MENSNDTAPPNTQHPAPNTHPEPNPLVYGLLKTIARLLFYIFGGIRVTRADRVPKTGGVLICPNHPCDADPIAIGIALPRVGRFVAKSSLFSDPGYGWILRALVAIPIKRDSADRAALRLIEARLRAGDAVILFPEGGGNPEGVLQPLHPGALLLALKTRVPVIPVAIRNTNKILPYGTTRPRYSPDPVTVTFGEPLDLSDITGKRGAIDEATRRLTITLATMLNQPIPEGKPVPREE